MSFLGKLKDRVEQAAIITAEKVGFVLAEDSVVEQRIALCNECPNLFTPTRSCKLCGCFIDLKTKNQKSRCPINKW